MAPVSNVNLMCVALHDVMYISISSNLSLIKLIFETKYAYMFHIHVANQRAFLVLRGN